MISAAARRRRYLARRVGADEQLAARAARIAAGATPPRAMRASVTDPSGPKQRLRRLRRSESRLRSLACSAVLDDATRNLRHGDLCHQLIFRDLGVHEASKEPVERDLTFAFGSHDAGAAQCHEDRREILTGIAMDERSTERRHCSHAGCRFDWPFQRESARAPRTVSDSMISRSVVIAPMTSAPSAFTEIPVSSGTRAR